MLQYNACKSTLSSKSFTSSVKSATTIANADAPAVNAPNVANIAKLPVGGIGGIGGSASGSPALPSVPSKSSTLSSNCLVRSTKILLVILT